MVQFADQSSIPDLLKALNSAEDIYLDSACIQALAQFPTPEVIKALVHIFESTDYNIYQINQVALNVLGQFNDAEVHQYLLKNLSTYVHHLQTTLDFSPLQLPAPVHQQMIVTLGKYQYKEAVPVLIQLLRFEFQDEIRSEILSALRNITGENSCESYFQWRQWQDKNKQTAENTIAA